jgi:3'5'-cyclic nucleotide phosphodiesterase
VARQYQGKSPAEQNSLDLAWNLLMDESYTNLRRAIYTTNEGLLRFRQLLVNSVMATDIVDKELKALRNARWDRAFSQEHKDEDPRDTLNRKATIVIEHLIQASDVSHTMQHWHIYRKWNEKFFEECYKAYTEGRAEKDPSEGWYQGELGFYDFYIIPLAKKLKDCGVFGVASDEYLNYAVRNRKEWEDRGREVVDEMVEKVKCLPWYTPRPESRPSH